MTDKPLNKYNEDCNGCNRKTVPFMGRTRICPYCEQGKTVGIDGPEGFEMKDPGYEFTLDLDFLDLDGNTTGKKS